MSESTTTAAATKSSETQRRKPFSTYQYTVGSRRPPSEAHSLLLCVHLGCPWRRCKFCIGYKFTPYLIRPAEHACQDVDLIQKYVHYHQRSSQAQRAEVVPEREREACQMAAHWMRHGMTSVFLQEADPLHLRPSDLVTILTHLTKTFPSITRVTAYARAKSIARLTAEELGQIRQAGLTRVHLGLESGSDLVLDAVDKGVHKQAHVRAGLLCKEVGIEVSENVMPGLGGVELSEEHVRETADALNQINPDIILLRTLALPQGTDLAEDYHSGKFRDLSEAEKVKEIYDLLTQLSPTQVTSKIHSDHCCNLLDLSGQLPQDRDRMLQQIGEFLQLPSEERVLFTVGRRMGIFTVHSSQAALALADELRHPRRRWLAEEVVRKYAITEANVDSFCRELTAEMF